MTNSLLTKSKRKKITVTFSDLISDSAALTILHSAFTAKNAIAARHKELGGNAGRLGPAVQNIEDCPDGIGSFQKFKNGRIYFTPATGAQEMYGAILDKWSLMGFETSLLGYPLQGELQAADGIGRYSRFQGGMIYWAPSAGAHEVHGDILRKWGELGFETGFLGYPVTDEMALGVNFGRFNNFQNGQIAWSPSSGASVSSSVKKIVSNGGIKPQGIGPDNMPVVRRVISVSAHMEITGDGTFGSNEHASQNGQGRVFVTNTFAMSLISLAGKAGEEVSIELKIDAIATVEGDAIIAGKVILYDDTGEESDYPDEITDISLIVLRDRIITQNITVKNSDEGSDFADITLTISNWAA